MRSLVLTSCLVALAGCASSNPGNLKKTAMADLGCPAKQLTIDQLQKSKAGSTFLVTGCGKTAQYQVTKKNAVRTTEVTAYVAPPPPAAPPPPDAPPPPQNAQQQADFNAFMQQHNERHAQGVADMQKSMDASTNKPLPSQQQPPPPPARPAEAGSSAPAASPEPAVRSSSSESGYVCLNGAYYACPNLESTAALGAYAECKFKCAMGGSCSACVVGAGEQCKREKSKDPSCN